MSSIGLIGYGRIGQCIHRLLGEGTGYQVTPYDTTWIPGATQIKTPDFENISMKRAAIIAAFEEIIKKHDLIIAATPYTINKQIAELCGKHNTGYIDLTEDVNTTNHIKQLAQQYPDGFFMPQCGLAPGAVSLIARDLLEQIGATPSTPAEEVQIRVGALPKAVNNKLQYALTWSPEGLVNEYFHQCDIVVNHEKVKVAPLSLYEQINIEGNQYEAFTTSGGIGSLIDTAQYYAKNINYKSIRYCGHLDELLWIRDYYNYDQQKVLQYFRDHVPHTTDDVVVIFIQVTKKDVNGNLQSRQYVNKIYGDERFTAIQLTTAAGVSAAVDWWFSTRKSIQRDKNAVLKSFVSTEEIPIFFFKRSFGSVYYKNS